MFCYLREVLDCEAGVERAVRARVAAAWKNNASSLVEKNIPFKSRGEVCETCIISLGYGNETWIMTGRAKDIPR